MIVEMVVRMKSDRNIFKLKMMIIFANKLNEIRR